MRQFVLSLVLLAIFATGAFGQPDSLRVMPLGDSITHGRGGVSETQLGFAAYRYWLWKELEAGSHPVDFVGSQFGVWNGEPPYTDYDQDHEGHWGWRVDQVLVEIGGWAQAANPDVVLIHLGTNDLWQGQSVSSTIDELGQVIDAIRVANSEVNILLAQLISAYPASLDSITPFNAEIPALAASKNSAESPVVVVDLFTGFDPWQHTYDGVHPNEPGEQWMAERWLVHIQDIIDSVTALPDAIPSGGGRLRVASMPNPFNPTTEISFAVPTEGEVHVSIHSVTGRNIAMLQSEFVEAGEHSVMWNGRDATGFAVASGVYFVRVSTAQSFVTKKIVLVK